MEGNRKGNADIYKPNQGSMSAEKAGDDDSGWGASHLLSYRP